MNEGDVEWDGDPERVYVITRGRSLAPIDLVTLIVAKSAPHAVIQPEYIRILALCEFPLSVVELSAYLRLPVYAVAVLVADLLADNLVEARDLPRYSDLPDTAILQVVINGLQKL